MGAAIQACKSVVTSKNRATPPTKTEEDIDNDDDAHFVEREFNQSFLRNTEDLIQEIASHSRWAHFEVRYLLAQFRRINSASLDIELTAEQFLVFVPMLVKSIFRDFETFQKTKPYQKWIKHFLDLFEYSENENIQFQSFVKILDTACRGTDVDKAKLLLSIFDFDVDGHWDEPELELFLDQVLQISAPNESENENNNNNNQTENANNACVIRRDGLIEYLQELLSPDTKSKSNISHKSNNNDDVKEDAETDGEGNVNDDTNTATATVAEDTADTADTNTETNTKPTETTDLLSSSEDNYNSNNEQMAAILGDLELSDLRTVDVQTLMEIVVRLLKERLYKKNKVKGEKVVLFASKCIQFEVVFASFMIIPTREDECKIIKDLVRSASMQLGDSWYVISHPWWEQWCAYTLFNADNNALTMSDDRIETKHALRPLKIDNGDLLDHNTHFRVLRQGLQENNEYRLLPATAWHQLHEWYGGGPSIARQVVCTDKKIRMKMLNFTIRKMLYDCKERLRLKEEALRRKKKKKNKESDDHKNKNNNKPPLVNQPSVDEQDIDAILASFRADEYDSNYASFLQELNFEVNNKTLRIDMHPIHLMFCRLNNKGKLDDDGISLEYIISRYATIPEVYISLCANVGYNIKTIDVIRNRYQKYIDLKRMEKTDSAAVNKKSENENDDNNNNNNNNGKKNKKNNKKNKKKGKNNKNNAENENDNNKNVKSKEEPLNLPPRLWLIDVDLNPTQMLYPKAKVLEKLKPEAADDDNNEADTDTTDDTAGNAPDVDGNEDADNDANTNTDTADANTNTTTTAAAETGADADANTNTDTADADADASEHIDEFEEMDLESIGVKTGYRFVLEFPYISKKNKAQYHLHSDEEELQCEPEVDDSWLQFEPHDKIDARDRWGKWYPATVLRVKAADEPLDKKEKLHEKSQDRAECNQLQGVFVNYQGWEEKWNEWIFVKEDTVCTCQRRVCETPKLVGHRLSAQDTQTKYAAAAKKARNRGSHGGGGGGGGGRSDYWLHRQRDNVRGAPSTAGCVGLVNLGNTCFMNSIIQCVSNTPHLRTFFTSGQYKPDVNKHNPLGMGGKLANEFAKLMTDVWSGEYKVIAPRSLKRALASFAPQFSGWQQHDSQEFLAFLLDGLHEDLNLIVKKPYTEKIEANGRSDHVVADLAWKIYLMRNKSKIVDLFQAQFKSTVVCPNEQCGKVSITFEAYMYLSIPIVGHLTTSIIVDIFHRNRNADINKPVRHVFHLNKYEKLRFLAREIGKIYSTKAQFITFYENFGMKVCREYDHNRMLGSFASNDAIACYIAKDWNKTVTTEQIRTQKIALCLAKMCHTPSLHEFTKRNKNSSRSYYGPSHSNGNILFGMPFVITFLNIHSRRYFHKVVYKRLQLWVGPGVLKPAPVLQRRLKKTSTTGQTTSGQTSTPENETKADPDPDDNTNNNHTADTDDNDNNNNSSSSEESNEHANTSDNDSKSGDLNDDEKDNKSDDPEDDDDGDDNDGGGGPDAVEYEDLTQEDYDAHEAEWDAIFENLPYTLRLLPYSHYSLYSKGVPPVIPVDDIIFDRTVKSKDTEVFIEWAPDAYEIVRNIVNKVVMDAEYSRWKKENAIKKTRVDTLTIYDCINGFVHEERLNENDLWYCSKCKEHKQAAKKIDLYSFPEIMIIHLKRFQILGRFGRGQKLNKFVDFPIRGLDLSPYVISDTIQSKPIYDLYAVSCHSGGCSGGHYTAYALNSDTDRWYYFNDSSVAPASPSKIVSSSAYVLFYKKCH